MNEFRRIRPRARISWTFDLLFAVMVGLAVFFDADVTFVPGHMPPIAIHAVTGLVAGFAAFGLPILSRSLLEGPEVWVFDSLGYSYSRASKIWPATRRVAYADIAHLRITHMQDRSQIYGLTLVMRSGKAMPAGTWDRDELAAIRDFLATKIPGSDLPLPV